MRKNPRRILSPQRLPFRHPGRAEIKHSTTCSRATLTLTTASKSELFRWIQARGVFRNGSTRQRLFVERSRLLPMRPSVALLFVFFSGERLDAKALRTLVANGLFRRLTAHIADVPRMFPLGIGRLTRNCIHGCLPCSLCRGMGGPSKRAH
jgi:hypothetical protein